MTKKTIKIKKKSTKQTKKPKKDIVFISDLVNSYDIGPIFKAGDVLNCHSGKSKFILEILGIEKSGILRTMRTPIKSGKVGESFLYYCTQEDIFKISWKRIITPSEETTYISELVTEKLATAKSFMNKNFVCYSMAAIIMGTIVLIAYIVLK